MRKNSFCKSDSAMHVPSLEPKGLCICPSQFKQIKGKHKFSLISILNVTKLHNDMD
jgi:hypothetical protein